MPEPVADRQRLSAIAHAGSLMWGPLSGVSTFAPQASSGRYRWPEPRSRGAIGPAATNGPRTPMPTEAPCTDSQTTIPRTPSPQPSGSEPVRAGSSTSYCTSSCTSSSPSSPFSLERSPPYGGMLVTPRSLSFANVVGANRTALMSFLDPPTWLALGSPGALGPVPLELEPWIRTNVTRIPPIPLA